MAYQLPSKHGGRTLFDDLSGLWVQIDFDQLDVKSVTPVLNSVIREVKDEEIWLAVYAPIAQTKPTHPPTTPPPSGPNFASAFKNTSNCFSSGSFQNTSEPVEMMRNVLRWELQSNLELDHPDFIATYLAEIPQVDDAATAVFKKCCDGKDPFYTTGYG